MAVILGAQGYGETSVSAIKLGSTTVARIYLGSEVVYGSSSSGGGSSSGYAISLIIDSTDTTQPRHAKIELATLPAGATGYKVEMSGTAEHVSDDASTNYTGVIVAVLSPADNQIYYTSTQSNISSNPSDLGNPSTDIMVSFNTSGSTHYLTVYTAGRTSVTNKTVKVTPIDNNYDAVGSASNELTGIRIDAYDVWGRVITLVSDASSSNHEVEAVISHSSNLEDTNAATYNLLFTWTQSSGSYSGDLSVPSNTNSTTRHTVGTSPYQISAKYNSSSDQFTIYSTAGYAISDMTVALLPLNSQSLSLGISNTLNNIELNEDG